MTNWSNTFDAIDLSIKSKDFEEARDLIDEAIKEANRVVIDPTFLLKQLRHQRKLVEDKIR